ncbi:methyltransferase [Halodurantibacterium flavum]|uniref:Methyltransferase n=1 Tax=Halodurantibacterium flavum TaxID=1382802 RepID=A0ABW4S7H1_9RHOB
MLSDRLTLALQSGLLALPASGRVAVFGATSARDLADLPRGRVQVIQRFRPDHDALLQAGWQVATAPEGDYTAAIVCLPRARAAAKGLIAEAAAHLPPGAPLVVDGQKTDGVDAMVRALRERVEFPQPISKAHGKIAVLPSGPFFADWVAQPVLLAGGFTTMPGVFSADGVDPASALLAATLPDRLPARVADLGAGWGYLSLAALARDGVEELHLVEADLVALDCARKNVADPRARFHWADARAHVPDGGFDAVIMNPPFHTARAADPKIGADFIAAAARMLTTAGTLWLVANRHLPYEEHLKARFREVEELAGTPAFKIYRAARPAATPKGSRPRRA